MKKPRTFKFKAKKLPATIPCQACNGRSGNGIGCGVCGGYGFVLQRIECPLCKRQALFRPAAHTMYEGKRFRSLDGLEFVFYMETGSTCIHCEKEE